MKAFFTCLLIVSCYNSFAQLQNAILEQINTLIDEQQYEKALPIAEEYLKKVSKEFGEEHRTYLDAVYKVAILYSQTNAFEKAVGSYEKYLKSSLKLNCESSQTMQGH